MSPLFQITFERHIIEENGEERTKLVKKTLFQRNNPYPQKKVMTFNRLFNDFSFNISYGNTDFLPEQDQQYVENQYMCIMYDVWYVLFKTVWYGFSRSSKHGIFPCTYICMCSLINTFQIVLLGTNLIFCVLSDNFYTQLTIWYISDSWVIRF